MFGGLLKAGKSIARNAEIMKGKLPAKAVTPAPVSFWTAKEFDGKALMPGKLIPADTPGYILAPGDLPHSRKTILAMMHGERMQFAVRYRNQDYDTVVSFAGTLTDDELRPLTACLDGLLERFKNEAAEADAK